MDKLKELLEKRNKKVEELQSIVDKAKEETRAMTKEEKDKFDTLEQEIKDLDATIEAEKRARDYEIKDNDKQDGIAEERALAEERAFECYIRGIVEERADVNLTVGDKDRKSVV